MFKRFLKKSSFDTPSLTLSYSVGIYFDDKTVSYVLLKLSDGKLSLESYKTVPLEEGILMNAKIVEMGALSTILRQLSVDFSYYTSNVVVALPQSFVTMEYFNYDPESGESLESEAEFRASKISSLDKINFDYHLFETEKDNGEFVNNVILTVAKNEDIDSRVYLTEISDLNLHYLDVESVARVNAYSFWINQENSHLEDNLIAIYEIGIDSTQVTFSKKGKILYNSEIPIGSNHLLNQITEYSYLDNKRIFSVLNSEFDITQHKADVSDIRKRLTQEIYRSIGVFYSQTNVTDDVKAIFLTGIGAKNFELGDIFQEMTDIEVQIINPVESVASSLNKNQLHSDSFYLTVAFGLALRGLL
ncbi:MAG: type IV pilus assembly protein PilM [Neisseriaceae bacterium]|nr:MAG: type IV pilus assembly protein PilM [Neisseriaceae bacterium]